jgi:rare lipoprotein A
MSLSALSSNLCAQNINLYPQSGKASFYANKFDGKRTASGEIYQHENFTAAHRSLSFGTWVKVVNLENNKSVIVSINDRGPFTKGRILDLSQSAAKELGSLNKGVFSISLWPYQKDLDPIQIPKIPNP